MGGADFIAAFFGSGRSTAPVFLASLANDRSESKKFPPIELITRDPVAIEKFITKWDKQGRALYFCINTLKPGKRRTKANVAELTCLHADLDFKGIGEDRKAIERVLSELALPPSRVVFSGHGLHCYWWLDKSLPATKPNVERIEAMLRGVAELLAGDPAVCEVSRLMRVPGSHNSKDNEWIEVETVVERDDSYSVDELEQWLHDTHTEIGPQLTRVAVDKHKNGKGNGADAGPVNFFEQYGEQQALAAPLDIEAMLDDIQYPGNVHNTERDIIASLISRGEPVDNAIAYMREQLEARIPEALAWFADNSETRELRKLIIDWFCKHPELLDMQEEKPDWLTRNSKIKQLGRVVTEQPSTSEQPKVQLKTGVTQPPPKLDVYTYDTLHSRDVVPLDWIVDEFILAGTLNGLFGDGGVGKDLLLLQLSIAMICGAQWLGRNVKQGRVLYFPVEDDFDELRRRDEKISEFYQSMGTYKPRPNDFQIVPMLGKDTVLAVFDGKVVRPTPLFKTVQKLIEEFKPTLTIVGNRVNIFSVSQNEDSQARQCLGLLNSLCNDFGTSIIMPSHASLGGIASGEGTSGSVQWNNGVRLRTYLRRVKGERDDPEPDPTMRELEVMKSNYSAKGERLTIFWKQGLFQTDDVVVEQPKPKRGETQEEATRRVKIERTKEQIERDDKEFLRMLNKYVAIGDHVSAETTARNNVWTVFARDPNCRLHGKKAAIRAAMERLFADGRIKSGQYGPPSKVRTHIILAS